MKKNFIISIFLLISLSLFAQKELKGVIKDNNNLEIFGANVYWLNTNTGTTTNETGTFSIPYKKEYKKLIISFVGYKTDTINVSSTKPINHYLTESNTLNEVAVSAKKSSTQRSYLQTQNLVTINSDELLKAACCNLSESFETNPSIDVNFSDALTGTKQIQMLGLTSPYLLITQENIPSIRGAAQAFGLTFTPGTWVESIQITKGAGSVVNGFESISGQINTELVKPSTNHKFYLNAYGALGGRLEFNTHFNQKVSEKWQTGLYVHGNYRGEKFDKNKDNFLDNPLAEQINVMNRWQYTDAEKGWVSFINFRYLDDSKQVGEVGFDPEVDKGSNTVWGSEIKTKRFDTSVKVGYVFPDMPFQNMGFQAAYSNHKQDSYFGLRDYNIQHHSFYSSFVFSSIIGDTRNKFKTGASLTYDNYEEFVSELLSPNFNRKENSVGAFFEYAYDNADNLSVTAGVRLDHHNLLGTFVTPRLHMRYVPWERGVLRASVGRGKRSANIFAENQQFFASSRAITIESSGGNIYGLDPEEAWNYGVSFLQGYKLFGRKGDVTFDFYQTNFSNQVVVDWENPQEISFYNLEGKSNANSFQIEMNQNIIPYFNTRFSYKFYDVSTDYKSGNLAKALQAKHRFFANVSYETKTEKSDASWKFDVTYNWIGEQRLPNTNNQLPTYSDSYNLLNTQITKVFSKKFEMYAGAENITNYKQKNPILGSDNPFGANFDTTIVYAPVFGSNFYAGLRFKID
ncbi:Outer membrane receptor proteins, mostly Fe transport [Tenacibaculum mesophilum]|uniref:TonB-dependent receptor n=1 Tax=Tenacibaculum mesophilum TaxID=104268 RepID=A0ABM7CFI5_9FLAO|nr:TonB-dependent receptor [Tenacibaculum mesophilum]AZJ32539.1 TonB-dependent receptor [Tenacibaculum mesophilum]QFS27790.1 TonB-dependent receptor [Tenacibaculum mesophilum]SHG08648.1 Outer membrane receptor proteins, mostly Fe transport [Tenacibaculum mesophilum]